MHKHFTLEDFEQLDFGPCACGCNGWVEWDDDSDSWVECDPYKYYVVDPEYKTKGDVIMALVVKRG